MTIILRWVLLISIFYLQISTLSAGPLQLVSTESDPDAYIQKCVNVINGDYCESATDLVISGPDSLMLQRFYSTKDPVSGVQLGSWRIFPQRFLVLGKDPSGKSCTIGKDQFEWTTALTGERSGGILSYCGWRNTTGTTKDPLKIDILNCGIGIVNTYAEEINGQNNHQNNFLSCKGNTCELTLGDGTKRFYQKVDKLPSLVLGEELTPLMTAQMMEPESFCLNLEILPSGNQVFFSYDFEGHLISIEMKNQNATKTLSWIHFEYNFTKVDCQINITTSDERHLIYHCNLVNQIYQLTSMEGSHCLPVTYEYNDVLVKKILPEGRFTEIDYEKGRVKSLKGPNSQTGKSEIINSFSYGVNYTDVFDAMGNKIRYIYDKRFQLSAIERYDQNKLYRIEQKFWGRTKSDAGLLQAKTIGDGYGRIFSYRSFNYDNSGNVIEEKLYGNLTGKQEVALKVTSEGKLAGSDEEECHIKTFGFSTDGLNLLTRMGDSKGNQTIYTYKTDTNLLSRKFIYDKGTIKNRTFQHYNEDGVCVKIIEDDGCEENESNLNQVTERHIKKITPKDILPGIGLPEALEKKALDLKTKQEILLSKLENVYDAQSNLLSCSSYDANGQYAFAEKRTYNTNGQVLSQTDAIGNVTSFGYDEIGNQISKMRDDIHTLTTYDFHNQPVQVTITTMEDQFSTINVFDTLGRKICSTDRYGNRTNFEYDAFNRLIKITHPEVLNENNQIIRPSFNYTYDIFGNVLTSEDPIGNIIKKSYNLRGDPTRINYPDGSHEYFKYDPEGSLHRSLSRDNLITVYEYDYLGRSIYEEVLIGSKTGVDSFFKSRKRNYNGFRCIYEKEEDCTKRYTFDAAGRLASIVECENWVQEQNLESRLSEISYDSLGRIHQKKIWFDKGPQDYGLEFFEHDLSGNVIEKIMEDSNGNLLIKKCFSYNSQGRCIEEYSLDNGVKTSLIKTYYNSEGEPVGYIDGNDNETKIAFNHNYRNSLGQTVLKKTLVNALGVQTEIEFDPLNRIHSIIKKNPFGHLLSCQKTFYDPMGNKTCEVHDQIVEGEIIGSQKIRWAYGVMGRLEEEIIAEGSSSEKRTKYCYDSTGKMNSKSVSGVSSPIKYSYTKDGKLNKIEAYNSKNELLVANTYSYDPKGNILFGNSLHNKTVHRTYNSFNQIIKESIKDDEGFYNLSYKYDRKGRIKEIILPDNSKIGYCYDFIFGREVKRISAEGDVLYTHTYDKYDSLGRLETESCIGYTGLKEYTYDLNGHKTSSKNEFFSEQYVRDPLGRLLKVTGDKTEKYTYNHLSQLISEEKEETKTYLYDSIDNRIQAGNDELIYNGLNQLTSSSKGEFEYDSQGNLSRKILDGEETRFESNVLSQITSIEKADKTVLDFSYDPFGRLLVEKHLSSKGYNKTTISTSRYFYLGNQEIGTLTKAGKIESLKIPGLHGNELSVSSVAFELNGGVYVPFHDVSGNVISLIDPYSCELIERYQYSSFGLETIFNTHGEVENSSSVGNPWRFAEKRVNPNTGLIHFGLRFYDPILGRWISQDPAGFIDGPNLYSFVHNNPTNHFDRFGLTTEDTSSNVGYLFGEVETHCYCEKHRNCKRGGDIGKTISSHLPKVTMDTYFEKYYKDFRTEDLIIKDCYEDSTCYDLSADGRPSLPNDLGIGFINGVWNNSANAKESAQYISKLASGYNIHGVHNATHGTRIDVCECILGMFNIGTEPVRQLHKMWNSFFEKSSANSKYLMICHSQGAIHVANALLDYPSELRERILVVAIAPGAYIYQETCAQVIHYRAEWWRDFIPRLNITGARREKDSIITLSSHQDAPYFDHIFMSPTYEGALRYHIDRYIESRGEFL